MPARADIHLLLPLLLAGALTGCPAQQGGQVSYGGTYGTPSSGGGAASTQVQIAYQRLPTASVENNTTGVPGRNPAELRRIFCVGRANAPVIFYHVIVNSHWHYYWICSDPKPRRASSAFGAQQVKVWLRGFVAKARSDSIKCQRPDSTPLLQGAHQSGIRAVAHCDGQITLTFPDGGRSIRRFPTAAVAPTRVGGYGTPQPTPVPAAAPASCPPCRAKARCPVTRCPPQRTCPPKTVCPPRPKCPACDCSKVVIAAGRKGFVQGVEKACKRICGKIYKKCRKLDPNTSLCYQVSEYCAAKCQK